MSLITHHPLPTAQPSRHQHLIHVLPRFQYDRSDSSAPRHGTGLLQVSSCSCSFIRMLVLNLCSVICDVSLITRYSLLTAQPSPQAAVQRIQDQPHIQLLRSCLVYLSAFEYLLYLLDADANGCLFVLCRDGD